MTVAEAAIAAYLQTGEFGTVGSTIFVDTKPATPDAVISVFGYAGSPGEHTHDTSGNARPGIQVWVRGTKDATGTARNTIESVYNYLDGLTNTSLSGVYFEGIFANQSPEPMGKDENGRPEFAVNFSTIIRR